MPEIQDVTPIVFRSAEYVDGFEAAKRAIAAELEADANRMKAQENHQQSAALHAAAIVARSTAPR